MLARILDPRRNSKNESAPSHDKESRTRTKRATQKGQERRQEGARGVKVWSFFIVCCVCIDLQKRRMIV